MHHSDYIINELYCTCISLFSIFVVNIYVSTYLDIYISITKLKPSLLFFRTNTFRLFQFLTHIEQKARWLGEYFSVRENRASRQERNRIQRCRRAFTPSRAPAG